MGTKHTLGPWRAELTTGEWIIRAKNLSASGYIGGLVRGGAEHEANARLVAAAPELLAALRELADDIADRFDMDSPSTNPGMRNAMNCARAAIAKAIGVEANG